MYVSFLTEVTEFLFDGEALSACKCTHLENKTTSPMSSMYVNFTCRMLHDSSSEMKVIINRCFFFSFLAEEEEYL